MKAAWAGGSGVVPAATLVGAGASSPKADAVGTAGASLRSCSVGGGWKEFEGGGEVGRCGAQRAICTERGGGGGEGHSKPNKGTSTFDGYSDSPSAGSVSDAPLLMPPDGCGVAWGTCEVAKGETRPTKDAAGRLGTAGAAKGGCACAANAGTAGTAGATVAATAGVSSGSTAAGRAAGAAALVPAFAGASGRATSELAPACTAGEAEEPVAAAAAAAAAEAAASDTRSFSLAWALSSLNCRISSFFFFSSCTRLLLLVTASFLFSSAAASEVSA